VPVMHRLEDGWCAAPRPQHHDVSHLRRCGR
jgi:hypothetical protein